MSKPPIANPTREQEAAWQEFQDELNEYAEELFADMKKGFGKHSKEQSKKQRKSTRKLDR